MTKAQIRRIQSELLRIYRMKCEHVNYSYMLMAKDIQDYWIQEMSEEIKALLPQDIRDLPSPDLHSEDRPTDNFRKFVLGTSRSMKPERLWACFFWLCWDENEYSSWNVSDFFTTRVSNFISLLDEHLFQNADQEPVLDYSLFEREYVESGETTTHVICFDGMESPHCIRMRFYEEHCDELRVYFGHLTIGPDDKGFAFLQSAFNGDTRLFCFIPNGSVVFKGSQLKEFSLVEIGSEVSLFQETVQFPTMRFSASNTEGLLHSS